MNISDLMQTTFKNIGNELDLDISVISGELCVKQRHPVTPSPVSFMLPSMPMVQKCQCDSLEFFLPAIKAGLLTREQMHHACKRYMLGRSKTGHAIFWMIDEMGNVQDGNMEGQWISVLLKQREPELLRYWHAKHCLFGLHLTTNITKPVAIVESAASAVLLSEIFPECHWLATVYPVNFTIENILPLQGSNIILFPSTDSTMTTYTTWQKIAEQAHTEYNLNIECSTILEDNATAMQKARGIDLLQLIMSSSLLPV